MNELVHSAKNFGHFWAPQSRIVQQIEAMSSRQSWNEEEDDSDSDGGNKKVRKMTQKIENEMKRSDKKAEKARKKIWNVFEMWMFEQMKRLSRQH